MIWKLTVAAAALALGYAGAAWAEESRPATEEAAVLPLMNQIKAHKALHRGSGVPVVSPWSVMLKDSDPATFADSRKAPPDGLKAASSEIFDVAALKAAGYRVVTWTVNDKAQMLKLMKLGVNGIISDRPDLLRAALVEFDADGDGRGGDYLKDGLVDTSRFDAQGHRGGRNLRPENTLPAMESALDNLMSTLETDTGVTKDGVRVLSHDPHLQAEKCRRVDGASYAARDEVLIEDVALKELQGTYICDKLLSGRSDQRNEASLSPVAVSFAKTAGLQTIYTPPTVAQLFDFVAAYGEYYADGAGKSHPEAILRATNAKAVRFNIETKLNPRAEFSNRTLAPEPFVKALVGVIQAKVMLSRVDVQSFDFRTIFLVQELEPKLGTVCLFGDFPAPGGDGTNLQDENGKPSPWLPGLHWPYRATLPTAH